MKKIELIKLIMSYKESAAFITAYEICVFKELHNGKKDLGSLAHKLSVNESHLYLLMVYLKSLDIVCETDMEWGLTEAFEENYGLLEGLNDVIYHEKNIYQRWMFPDQLEQALKAEKGVRNFDRIGFTEAEQNLYNKTMYGQNLKILSTRLMREIRECKNPSLVEYGRSKDNILKALSKIGYKFDGYCMPEGTLLKQYKKTWDTDFIVLPQDAADVKFDVAILYNTIHYYDDETIADMFKHLKVILNKNALVLVVDLFYENGDVFSSGILLDWITHGGVNFITQESVENEFIKNGFGIVHAFDIKDINTSVLITRLRNCECA